MASRRIPWEGRFYTAKTQGRLADAALAEINAPRRDEHRQGDKRSLPEPGAGDEFRFARGNGNVIDARLNF